LVVDGKVLEDQALTSNIGISAFAIPINPTDPFL
jgi:hypothetical protein